MSLIELFGGVILATDHIETARQFLADADREYEAGNILQASEKLWGAASHVVIAELKKREIGHRTHRSLVEGVQKLADEWETPILYEWFIAARRLHANFYNGDLEDWEYEEHRLRVHWFVERMIELTD